MSDVVKTTTGIGALDMKAISIVAKELYALVVNVTSGLMEAVKSLGGHIYKVFEMFYQLAGYLGGLVTSSWETVRP